MVQRALASAGEALNIAADGGARVAQALGVALHTVIGDMDSLSEAELATLAAAGVQIKRYPVEKNETDLELALLWARQNGVNWMRLVGALGGRLDHQLSNIDLLALPALAGCDVRLVAGNQEAWLLYPGENVLEGAAGDTISLLPLNGTVQAVRTANLYYPLRDEPLLFGQSRGVSNVMKAEQARVWLREGLLLVVHTLEETQETRG